MPKTSRFNDTWKAHNSSGPGAFDNTLQQQQQPNFGFNPGPSGDSVLNGMRYNSPMDELSMNKPFFSSLELPTGAENGGYILLLVSKAKALRGNIALQLVQY